MLRSNCSRHARSGFQTSGLQSPPAEAVRHSDFKPRRGHTRARQANSLWTCRKLLTSHCAGHAIWVTLGGMAHFAPTFRPLACVSLAIVFGCGGTTSSTSSSAVTESDFPASYSQAMCDLLSKCCNTNLDTTACRASVVPLAVPQFQKYDPTNGGACIAELRNFASSCTASAREYATACDTLSVGNQAIGAPCQSSEDCAGYATSQAYCTFGTSASSQICRSTVKAGEPCSVLDPNTGVYVPAACGAGLYCATSELCAPKVSLGQPCVQPYSTDNCVAPLRCDPAAAMTCASLAPNGASCLGDGDCVDGYCSNGTCQGTVSITTSRMCNANGGSVTPAATVDAGM